MVNSEEVTGVMTKELKKSIPVCHFSLWEGEDVEVLATGAERGCPIHARGRTPEYTSSKHPRARGRQQVSPGERNCSPKSYLDAHQL